MNLTDLQTELRSIEEHLASLHSEIDRMKPKTEEKQKSDYDVITKLAKKQPIENQMLLSAPESVRMDFINSLSCLMLSEDQDRYSRLLYLCRLSRGCGLGQSAEEIYKSGLEFDTSDMDDLYAEMKEYKYIYLVEAFILANLSGKASCDVMLELADLTVLLECDEEEVYVIAQVAKSVLIKNPDVLKDIPLPSTNRWNGKFIEYIPEEWLAAQQIKGRHISLESGSAYDKHSVEIISRVKDGSVINKGETIIVYKEKGASRKSYYKAPGSGVVYTVKKRKAITIYIVSCFDSYRGLCSRLI